MGRCVLYVDDDQPNLIVFQAAFADDFEVLTASDPRVAVELLARHDVALLLTDQRMPGMSGTELCELARRDHPAVVRFLISAYADLDAVIDAINRGHVDRYLRKPWDVAELGVQLREGLELYALNARIRELERRMREVERVYALGVVAASVVHELRNPMSVVASYVDLARAQAERLAVIAGDRGADAAAELDHLLGSAWEGVMRMAEVARGVELSSQRQVGVSRAELGDVVQLTLKVVGAKIVASIAPGLIVSVNPTQLGQVALNLIVNAMQAVQADDDRVVVTVERLGDDRARLVVSDDGPGVPDDFKAKIFDPFFTTKLEGGTGLGLAICRKIVEDADGTLTVTDTAGGGATFTVELPLVP